MAYVITTLLIILSALFSGLTLGLLSLDMHSLKRRAKRGDSDAQIVYPIRERGNLLLTTLLLGNVAVNTTLSIFLGSIASGLVAGVVATGLIVIFGEIIPQAVISRHALWFGAKTAWFTKIVMLILFPIAWPISKVLDKLLGSELPTTYSKTELMDIVAEHEASEHSDIDSDERRIVHGALRFSHVYVEEAMTPAKEVVMYEENQKLTDDFFEELTDEGFSRMPVYKGVPDNIVGVLFAKDLLVEDEEISIKDTEEALEREYLTVGSKELLDSVLVKMLKQKRHLAIVKNKQKKFVGVISLEDILEEIIQQEIVDEDDDEE